MPWDENLWDCRGFGSTESTFTLYRMPLCSSLMPLQPFYLPPAYRLLVYTGAPLPIGITNNLFAFGKIHSVISPCNEIVH